jgi:hypothetical protein
VTEKDPAADRLEQLVDQFDSLWQQGSGPKWTAWLEQAGPAEQTKLARLLVPIELEYRRQRGETIKPEQALNNSRWSASCSPPRCTKTRRGLRTEPQRK